MVDALRGLCHSMPCTTTEIHHGPDPAAHLRRLRRAHAHRRVPRLAVVAAGARPRRHRHQGRASPREARTATPCRKSSWATSCRRASARRPRGRPPSTPASRTPCRPRPSARCAARGCRPFIFGAKTIAVGDADLVMVGGMESMSNVPYYLEKARSGYRMGDGKIVDGMIYDGLWDPYSNVHMGNCGDKCAAEYKFTREQQDDFSKESFRRALAAQKEGMFDAEIEAVSVPQKKGDALSVKTDEGPAKGDPSKFAEPQARVLEGRDDHRRQRVDRSTTARARSSSRARRPSRSTSSSRWRASSATAASAQAPEWFTTAPAKAIDETVAKLGPHEGPDRPLRDQRGLRRRDHGVQQALRARPAEGERARRRRRARAPHRRDRRAPAHDARSTR